MKKEDKDLLLKDLCARLPYNVNVDITYSKEHGSSDRLRICSEGWLPLNTDVLGLYIQDEIYLKPYLRPMSSMTEVEKEEYCALQDKFLCSSQYPVTDAYELFDWLNKNMFDYRGLIQIGLAIAVTEENNPYKKE